MPVNAFLASHVTPVQRPRDPAQIDADAAYGCVDWYAYPAEPSGSGPPPEGKSPRLPSAPAWAQLHAIVAV